MNYQANFRDLIPVKRLQAKIAACTTQPWKVMEICGGQTHAIAKYGLFDLLPKEIELIHGPGCPVCVTSQEILDQVMHIAALPNVILCTFGDMLRVPGSEKDLFSLKAEGADVRLIYSPIEAVQCALQFPDKEIVLFAVGFETTAPAHAMAIQMASTHQVKNFSVVTALVLVPPAIEAILQSPLNQVQGFLAAGHVCTIMGNAAYEPIAKQYGVPIVITGFEPVDILQGIFYCIQALEQNTPTVINAYARSVKPLGNLTAQTRLNEVFQITDTTWRGIGIIPQSGLKIASQYAAFDASLRFGYVPQQEKTPCSECISGEILQGLKKPNQCPAFKKRCTPEIPLGAPMVSHEGACHAYYRYIRDE